MREREILRPKYFRPGNRELFSISPPVRSFALSQSVSQSLCSRIEHAAEHKAEELLLRGLSVKKKKKAAAGFLNEIYARTQRSLISMTKKNKRRINTSFSAGEMWLVFMHIRLFFEA